MVDVEQWLKSRGILFVRHNHPEVYTTEDMKQQDIPGLACKNLFLCDQRKRRFFLVVTTAVKRVDLKKIGEIADVKISFGSESDLNDKLGLDPGSVSPFGLLNDSNCQVELFVDKEVLEADQVSFHPNINTASLELTGEMFRKYLSLIDHEAHIIDI